MSLTDQINRERKIIDQLDDAIKEARRELWDAEFVRRNDERRKGESDQHWHRRRKRNREAVERRDDVVDHFLDKRKAHERIRDELKEHKHEFHEEHSQQSSGFEKGSTSIVTLDGKPCVEDLAYWLVEARDHGWNGVLVSGYRTPAYSTQLCIGMCGQPTCPGRCAGATSNHAKLTYPGPAGDVTDYINCERVLQSIGAPYFNDLPLDLVHMSRSGH